MILLKVERFLNQAYRLNELIKSNNLEIAELNQLKISLSGIDYSKDRVQTTQSGEAAFTKVIDRIDELIRIIEKDNEEMLYLRLKIRNAINGVQDNEEKLLLKYRYLNFMTWEQICEEMNVSSRTAFRIRVSALNNVKIPE